LIGLSAGMGSLSEAKQSHSDGHHNLAGPGLKRT
jgi:hypothetical protein